jgi:hypothetical protein
LDFRAVDGAERVRYGVRWRGEPETAESSAKAEDPMNLIQVMLAKGYDSSGILLPSLRLNYDRD